MTAFNQELKLLVCMASPLPLWAALQRNFMSGDPRERQ